MDVRVGLWRRLSAKGLMLLNYGVGEDSWESLGLQGDPTSPFWRRSALGFLWKEWSWSWSSSTLDTSFVELTHWKRLWCWEGLGAGGEGDDRGWDGWMASLTWWAWAWVNSGSWWWTGRPGVLQFMGSQRVGHDWGTELNWTELRLVILNFTCQIDWGMDIWLNTIIGMSVGVFLDEISTWNSRLSKAGCPLQCGRASSNQLKAQIEENVRENSLSLPTFELGHRSPTAFGLNRD